MLIRQMPSADVHTHFGTNIKNISAPTTIRTTPHIRVPLAFPL